MTNAQSKRLSFGLALLLSWLGNDPTSARAADPKPAERDGPADVEEEALPPIELGFFVQSGAAVTTDGSPRFSLMQLGVQHYFFRLSLAIDHDHFEFAGDAGGELMTEDESISILQVGPSLAVVPRIDIGNHLSLVPGLRGALQVGAGSVVVDDRRADADVLTATSELQFGIEYLKQPSSFGSPALGAYLTIGFTDILRSRYATADDWERFELVSHGYVGISLHAAFYLFEKTQAAGARTETKTEVSRIESETVTREQSAPPASP